MATVDQILAPRGLSDMQKRRRRIAALMMAGGGGGDVVLAITSGNTDSVAENATLLHQMAANKTVSWSIIGGADQARFELSGSTLRWAGNGTKDYEAPNDTDTNNDYSLTVRATDAALNTTDQAITVTVTDVVEASPPTAPVLSITSDETDDTPEFTIDMDNTVASGDSVTLQVQANGGDWSSPIVDQDHTITAGEDSANAIFLDLASLADGDYEARCLVTVGVLDSAWSNVVDFTIGVSAEPDFRLMWGADRIMWGADRLVWGT